MSASLVPTLVGETLLACIIDEEPECYPEGSASDTWNTVVKEKKIGGKNFMPRYWCTSVYKGERQRKGDWDNMDCCRPEGLDKTVAEENYDRAKGKDRDTENEENTTDKRLSKRLNKRLRKSKRLSKKLRKSKGKRSKRSSSRVKMVKRGEEEQEKEVQDSEKEAEKEPRGRTKAVAAGKLVHTPPEKFFQFARPSEEEELARLKERCVVQAEKLWRQIEEEESDEKSVESFAEEEVEKTQKMLRNW
ncbi:LOW QUALITY PROTEIN: hypothetical protein HID58_044830 [Brassica napus]|uniref:Uncharacterized protein n=1 Tax=Brassica napus TaxID=3708 RepID=A0ABQ7XHQ3_BRANA|nr:LOW QUALITY PROTEIN: hypothetical protein HID58_044830 [Brassica napus]